MSLRVVILLLCGCGLTSCWKETFVQVEGPKGVLHGMVLQSVDTVHLDKLAPAQGVTVTTNPYGVTAVTDSNGEYSLELEQGTYHLYFQKEGYGSVSVFNIVFPAPGTVTAPLAKIAPKPKSRYILTSADASALTATGELQLRGHYLNGDLDQGYDHQLAIHFHDTRLHAENDYILADTIITSSSNTDSVISLSVLDLLRSKNIPSGLEVFVTVHNIWFDSYNGIGIFYDPLFNMTFYPDITPFTSTVSFNMP